MIQPSAVTGVPLERQQFLIDTITSTPLRSFVFSGFGGAGKTTLMRYQKSLLPKSSPEGGSIFITAMEWQKSITDFACGRMEAGRQPWDGATIAKRTRGLWVVFFLDDVDKLRGTEFCEVEFFSLIDTFVDNPNHYLVMSTNLSKDEFRARFGDSIMWRVLKICTWVEMNR
jgi:hypothetical protein